MFDQFVEYQTTEGIYPVDLQQHALESTYTLDTIVRGYKHAAALGRPAVANAELAMVFSEWSAQDGLPDAAGIVASMVLAPWPAKSVAVGYVVATTALLDTINQQRTTAIALVRLSLTDDTQSLPPNEPFTAGQVTALATWLSEHAITNSEFAALFGVTAAQLANWLQTHTRAEFAYRLWEQFA